MSQTTTTNPETELRRITRRISELQARQRELIAELGLTATAEKAVLAVLDLAQEVDAFTSKNVDESVPRQRQRIVMSKKVSRAFDRLSKLPDSEAKAAAISALTEAANRLLERFAVSA
jgi:hypothetical protein